MNNYFIILQWVLCFGFISILIIIIEPPQYKFHNSIEIEFVSNHQYYKIEKDNVRKQIMNFLNQRDSINKDINTSMLEDLISEHKDIKKAEVYLDIEGSLKAYVYFRKPFVKIVKDDRIYYCDSNMVVLPLLIV